VATADQIAAFRLLISAPDNEDPYTDEVLSDRIDAATSSEALAAQIWREKAAEYAQLVSVSESGSSRQLSDLHKNALEMAKAFGAADVTAPGASAVRGIRMHRLTRP
jgi:Cdc6-like AAA superfamily ATPase